MFDTILIFIGFIGICVGTITDLEKREVADWLNFSLIATGVLLRILYGLQTNDWLFVLWGAIGFLIAFSIAHLMYYTGQWGGGDAKMLMGLGILFATYSSEPLLVFTTPNIATPLMFFIIFFLNTMIVGAVLGILYSIYKAIEYRDLFLKTWSTLNKKKSALFSKIIALFVGVILLIASFFTSFEMRLVLIIFALVLISSIYIMIFIRSVERGCMIQHISPMDLVEGDWIEKPIIINDKTIASPKDLGIDEHQIKVVQNAYKKGLIKKVTVKIGMPFVPAFFLGTIATILFGNLLAIILI